MVWWFISAWLSNPQYSLYSLPQRVCFQTNFCFLLFFEAFLLKPLNSAHKQPFFSIFVDMRQARLFADVM